MIINLTTAGYSSKVGQNQEVISLSTLMIVEMGNCTYDEWKTVFDADSDTDAQFMTNIIDGKVDEHTEIVGADVFASEK